MAAAVGALRIFLCGCCREQVYVCRECDRGQIYCLNGCAEVQRQASKRRASARYQKTLKGARSHSKRQLNYRARINKVTHHSSMPMPGAAELARTKGRLAQSGTWLHRSGPKTTAAVPSCHFCGCCGDGYVRNTFLYTGNRLL